MRRHFQLYTGLSRGDFISERADLGLSGLISSLKEPDFDLRGPGGRIYRRMDGLMGSHPCVLQDISSLGPLPKKGQGLRDRETKFKKVPETERQRNSETEF